MVRLQLDRIRRARMSIDPVFLDTLNAWAGRGSPLDNRPACDLK
jgi:hypothetical protein